MAMQQTNSSFSKRLGAQLAHVNAEHRDKPIDTGNRRLPAGIRNGIAKLQFMYTKEQDKDDGICPKGEVFFRASAVVLGQIINGVLVKDHKGEAIDGLTTSKVIPLCDIPEKVYPGGGKREAVTLSQNWFEFQNLFKLLSNGSIVCKETENDKIEAFYFSAMAALTNPKFPVYISFSTEAFKSKKRPNESEAEYAAREPFVVEKWHGLAHLPAGGIPQHNPAAGVNAASPSGNGAHPMDPPQARTNTSAPQSHQQTDESSQDDDVYVAGLVEVAMGDPECKTPDGAQATSQLEQMAWERGWTKEQTAGAKDWAQVGEMALAGPGEPSAPPAEPTVGSKWMYAKRTKDGVKYKDNKGTEFPAQECEVVTVDTATKTVTLKTCHDGKVVADLRTKKPIDVKFEWLESAPPY